MTQEFAFSDAFLAGARRRLIVIALLPPVFVSVGLLVGHGGFAGALALVAVWVVAFLWFLFAKAQLGQWGRFRLLVQPDGVVRDTGKQPHNLPWERIRKVRIHEDSRGTPRSVQIFPRTGPSLLLTGFEAMPDLAVLVQAGVPATVPVEVKRHRWSSRDLFLFAAFLAAFIIAGQMGGRFLGTLFGRYAFRSDFSAELVMIVVALLLLANRNAPQLVPRSRRGDLICALLLLGWALASLLFKALR